MFKSIFAFVVLITSQAAFACEDPCDKVQQSASGWSWIWYFFTAIGALVFIPMVALIVWIWAEDRLYGAPKRGAELSPDDPDYIAATLEAQTTLPQFFEALDNSSDNEHIFTVLVTCIRKNETKIFWAYPLKWIGSHLIGIDQDYEYEDEDAIIEIPTEQILDWSYKKDGITIGSFIEAASLYRYPPRVVKRLKKQNGWD